MRRTVSLGCPASSARFSGNAAPDDFGFLHSGGVLDDLGARAHGLE
jgi:hypothetical protein